MNVIPNSIKVSDYDYDLPDDRIAQFPAKDRDGSKLLLYSKGVMSEDRFKNIYKHLPTNSLLVFNNTKVIRARVLFQKTSGANIEVFCLEPSRPANYDSAFSSPSPVEWRCIVGNLKKWKGAPLSMPFVHDGRSFTLMADRVSTEGDSEVIRFSWQPSDVSFGEIIDAVGHIPLPPYIKRGDTPEDDKRYQTVYSSVKGSVAAPTAGLHFTDTVIEKIREQGIKMENVTLHVGAGTFRPIKSDTVMEHEMHREHFTIRRETVKKLLDNLGQIIAVGTTTVRTLESIYWIGTHLCSKDTPCSDILSVEQWEPYSHADNPSVRDALSSIIEYMERNELSEMNAVTGIMIVPGYEFKVVSGIITNFHQPKSTLLLLLAAWVGEKWRDIYSFAMERGFRFLSYGDSSLLLK